MNKETLFLLYITVSMLSAVASSYAAETALKAKENDEGGWTFVFTAILLIPTAIFWFVMALYNLPK